MTRTASDDPAREGPATAPAADSALDWSLDAPLPFALLSLMQRINAQARALLAGRCDLTVPEWRIVRVLGTGGIDGSTALRKAAMIEKSQFSRTLAALEARGVLTVAPSAEDRRQTRLTLTPEGRALHDRIAPLFDARNLALNDALTGAERAMMAGALRKLAAAAERSDFPEPED